MKTRLSRYGPVVRAPPTNAVVATLVELSPAVGVGAVGEAEKFAKPLTCKAGPVPPIGASIVTLGSLAVDDIKAGGVVFLCPCSLKPQYENIWVSAFGPICIPSQPSPNRSTPLPVPCISAGLDVEEPVRSRLTVAGEPLTVRLFAKCAVPPLVALEVTSRS